MKGRLRRSQGSPDTQGSGHGSGDDPQSQIHWYLMCLVLTYTAWLIMTPYNRFDFLTTIRFERVLMLITLVVAFASGRITLARGKLSVLLALFLLALYISHFLTPDRYARSSMVVQWSIDYWKLIVLYFVLAAAIHTRKELTIYALGTLFVLTFYWAYTLNDYRGGGSYVWQQGVPRLVGVWVPRDVGAANYTGVVGVLMIPFSVFCADVYRHWKGRLVSLATLALAMTVVILSGTRGALIASVGLLLWTFRRELFKVKWLATATIGVYLAIALLPPNLTERYLSVFSSKSESTELDAYAQKAASDSAKSRVEGLEDGYALFLNRPLLGYGPGASSAARAEVTDIARNFGLELHNLYGQVLAETGIIGTFLFVWMLWLVWRNTRRGEKLVDAEGKPMLIERAQARMINGLLIGNLLYGLVAHSLYRFYWILVFAMAHAFLHVIAASQSKTSTGGQPSRNTRAPLVAPPLAGVRHGFIPGPRADGR